GDRTGQLLGCEVTRVHSLAQKPRTRIEGPGSKVMRAKCHTSGPTARSPHASAQLPRVGTTGPRGGGTNPGEWRTTATEAVGTRRATGAVAVCDSGGRHGAVVNSGGGQRWRWAAVAVGNSDGWRGAVGAGWAAGVVEL